MSCGLLNAVERLSPRTISVVGLAKNCGKTTALNHLVAGYRAAAVSVGATSAGRDGEAVDAITRKAKPSIELPPGTPVVTSEGTLSRWTAPHEILSRLD